MLLCCLLLPWGTLRLQTADDHSLSEGMASSLLDKFPMGTLPTTVKKVVMFPGKVGDGDTLPEPPYPSGSRLRFHFKVVKGEDTVLDDSHNHPTPMELIIGKQFKVEIWELAVNTMRVGEIASFECPTSMCVLYPMVAKVLRDTQKKSECSRPKSGCCGNMMNGTGYPDLDELLKSPAGLSFTFELLEVKRPGEYEPESWYMTDDQKAESLSKLRSEGNALFQQDRFKDAENKYFEAICRIEQLLTKEVPGSQEMQDLKQKKVPLLLNYSLCKQKLGEYHEAITHLNTVLEIDPENVKAHFRRGQSYKMTGSFELAKDDFKRVVELDATLAAVVKQEMDDLDLLEHKSEKDERQIYKRMFN